jgi:hypothetical protein
LIGHSLYLGSLVLLQIMTGLLLAGCQCQWPVDWEKDVIVLTGRKMNTSIVSYRFLGCYKMLLEIKIYPLWQVYLLVVSLKIELAVYSLLICMLILVAHSGIVC